MKILYERRKAQFKKKTALEAKVVNHQCKLSAY